MDRELHLKLTIRLYTDDNRRCFGPGIATLLERVREHRSLRAAASGDSPGSICPPWVSQVSRSRWRLSSSFPWYREKMTTYLLGMLSSHSRTWQYKGFDDMTAPPKNVFAPPMREHKRIIAKAGEKVKPPGKNLSAAFHIRPPGVLFFGSVNLCQK